MKICVCRMFDVCSRNTGYGRGMCSKSALSAMLMATTICEYTRIEMLYIEIREASVDSKSSKFERNSRVGGEVNKPEVNGDLFTK